MLANVNCDLAVCHLRVPMRMSLVPLHVRHSAEGETTSLSFLRGILFCKLCFLSCLLTIKLKHREVHTIRCWIDSRVTTAVVAAYRVLPLCVPNKVRSITAPSLSHIRAVLTTSWDIHFSCNTRACGIGVCTNCVGKVSIRLCSTSRICLREEATLWKFPFLPGLSWCLLVGLSTCHRKRSPWSAVPTPSTSPRTGCARLAQCCLLVQYVQHNSRRTDDRAVTRKFQLEHQRAAPEQACALADCKQKQIDSSVPLFRASVRPFRFPTPSLL